ILPIHHELAPQKTHCFQGGQRSVNHGRQCALDGNSIRQRFVIVRHPMSHERDNWNHLVVNHELSSNKSGLAHTEISTQLIQSTKSMQFNGVNGAFKLSVSY